MPARANAELDSLVQRIQAEGLSDELAARLYRQLYPGVLAMCARRAALRHRAEDLAHDALQRIFEGIDGFRFESSFATWAWRIARNVASNAERDLHAAKRHAIEVPLDLAATEPGPTIGERLVAGEASPEEHAERGELRRRAVDAVLELPGRMRRCWLLRELHGLSERQTAAVLGVSEGTVKSQTHEARKRLSGALPDLSDR